MEISYPIHPNTDICIIYELTHKYEGSVLLARVPFRAQLLTQAVAF